MSEQKDQKFGINFDKKISVQTIIAFLVFFWMEVRNDYINREQLDYIVIDRLDRLEKQLEEQLDRIEKKINEN